MTIEPLDEYYEQFFRGNRLYAEYARSVGESMQGLFLMRLLFKRQEGLCQRDIAQLLGAPKQTMSRLLKERVAAGLIEQTPSAADKREKLFALTPAGRLAAQQLIEPLDRIELACLDAAGAGLAEANAYNGRYLDAFESLMRNDNVKGTN